MYQIPIPQQSKPVTPMPQQKKLPPSKIHPRGWRPRRPPDPLENIVSFPADSKGTSPVLNELLSNDLGIHANDMQKSLFDKKTLRQVNNIYLQNAEKIEHNDRVTFFQNLISPPEALEMPEDPQLPQLPTISLHKERTPIQITGSVFSKKELDSIPMISNEENALTMRQSA